MDTRKQATLAIMESMQVVRRRLMVRKTITDITFSQWAVLSAVMKMKRGGIKEIATELDITPSAATQLVDELVLKGYLLREGSDRDRRAIFIKLSPKQEKNLKDLKAKRLKKFNIMFRVLDDEELRTYAVLNKKIAVGLLNR